MLTGHGWMQSTSKRPANRLVGSWMILLDKAAEIVKEAVEEQAHQVWPIIGPKTFRSSAWLLHRVLRWASFCL